MWSCFGLFEVSFRSLDVKRYMNINLRRNTIKKICKFERRGYLDLEESMQNTKGFI